MYCVVYHIKYFIFNIEQAKTRKMPAAMYPSLAYTGISERERERERERESAKEVNTI